jgi:hypothetical protein
MQAAKVRGNASTQISLAVSGSYAATPVPIGQLTPVPPRPQ